MKFGSSTRPPLGKCYGLPPVMSRVSGHFHIIFINFECVFATGLFICHYMDFEPSLCKMVNKKKDTRSATTNFGKEEVLIIRHGIQVFARNIRMSPFIMCSLSRINGPLPYICIYIYTYMYVYIKTK